jgi:hypothetical protein
VTLLIQTGGALALAAIVSSLMVGGGPLRVTMPALSAVIAIALGIAFFGSVWTAGISLVHERRVNARLSAAAIKGAGGTVFPAREDFLAWTEDRVPAGVKVFLACSVRGCSGLNEWISFRLLPRRFVERAREADWVIFYNLRPGAASDVPRGLVARPIAFQPTYQIGRVRP